MLRRYSVKPNVSVSLDAGASSDVTLTIGADALTDADALTTAGTYKVKVTATSQGDSLLAHTRSK
jgi:uncharacterized membrane protein